MKRNYLALSLLLLAATAVSAQNPVQVGEMTFVRHSFVRNFYNMKKVVGRIDPAGADLFLPRSNNLIVHHFDTSEAMIGQDGERLTFANPGSDPARTTETAVRVCQFHPYLTYEVEADGGAADWGMEFSNVDFTRRIVVRKEGGEIHLRYLENGRIVDSASAPDEGTAPRTIRVQATGQRLHAFSVSGRQSRLLFSFDIKKHIDLRDEHVFGDFSFLVSCRLPAGATLGVSRAEAALTCGTGQADPQVVQYADGCPYIRDGRMFVLLTTRGFQEIRDSYQGIYSIDISTMEWRLEGALFFNSDDRILHPWHATKVVYDEEKGRFLIITVSHAEDHKLYWAESRNYILSGINTVNAKLLDCPYQETKTSEDPDLIYDTEAGKWRLAYCTVLNRTTYYQTVLAESDNWNGPYTFLAISEVGNETGIRLQKIGGRYVVLSGGTNYQVYSYPDLRLTGTLTQRYLDGGTRGWATVTPIPDGDYTRYLWITFDRGAITGKYSYGTLYMYLSQERNPGYEYRLR